MKISERVLAEAEGRVAVIGLPRGTRRGNMALTELLPASILGCAVLRGVPRLAWRVLDTNAGVAQTVCAQTKSATQFNL